MARAVTTPHQAAYLSSEDTLLLLRFDEASGAAVDAAGNYTFTENGTVDSADGLFTGLSQGSRDFDGSNDYFDGSADTAARNALKANHTVECWFEVDSVSGTQVIFALTGTGSPAAQNTLGSLRLQDDELRYRWEHGSSTQVNVDTSGLGLETGKVYHAAIVVSDASDGTATKCDVDIYLGKAEDKTWSRVGGATNQTRATDGGSADWFVGATYGGSSKIDGRIDDLRISMFDALPEGPRFTFGTGVSSIDEATLYASQGARLFWRALIKDSSGDWVDLSDPTPYGYNFCVGYQIQKDIDQDMEQLQLQLARQVDGWSLARDVDSGPLGNIIDLARGIKVEVALVPDSWSEAPDCFYRTRFRGIVTNIDDGSDVMTLQARDDGEGLHGVFATSAAEYSNPNQNIALNTQDIIDDNDPADAASYDAPYLGERPNPQLYVPTASTWTQYKWTQAQDRILNILTTLWDQIGWSCRYRWDDHRQEHRLTAYEPNRSPSFPADLDHTIGPDEYEPFSSHTFSLDEIINVCTVTFYSSASTGNDGMRVLTTGDDGNSSSVDDYGRREAQLNHPNNIDNATEAGALAGAVVSDLGEPKATVGVVVDFRHDIDLQDYIRLEADGRTFDADKDVAVVGINEIVNGDVQNIVLRCRATAASRHDGWISRWLSIPLQGDTPMGAPPTPTGLDLRALEGAIEVLWDWPVDSGNWRVDRTEVHVGNSSGFTPDDGSLVQTVRGKHAIVRVAPGTHYVKLVGKDRNGVVSAATSASSVNVRGSRETVSTFRATGATGTSLSASSWNTVIMTSEEHDEQGDYDASTGVYTALETGLHTFTGVIVGVRSKVGARWQARLQKTNGGGATIVDIPYPSDDGTGGTAAFAADVKLSKGDTVELQVNPSISGDIETGSFWTGKLDIKMA